MSTSNENEHGSVGMKVPKITKNISKEVFSNWESLFGSYALVKGLQIKFLVYQPNIQVY